MPAIGAPPLALVVIIKFVTLVVAIPSWLFSFYVAVVAFPLLPMITSGGPLFWLATLSLVTAPIFIVISVSRIKDVSWDGVIDPIFAAVLALFSVVGALAVINGVGRLDLA